MSLSERLKAAEASRRAQAAAAAPSDEGDGDREPAPVIDLRAPGAPVVDLASRQHDWTIVDANGSVDIDYDPMRNGDASHAFGGDPTTVSADRLSALPCPRCGGATQIDLFDQVHQMVSLSCNSCFHMFRVPADSPAEPA